MTMLLLTVGVLLVIIYLCGYMHGKFASWR